MPKYARSKKPRKSAKANRRTRKKAKVATSTESSEQHQSNHAETSKSDTSPPPVDETALPRFTARANQHFEDVVDLSGLPNDLRSRMVSRAPFLLGLTDTTLYNKDFFNQVAGLCATGPHPNDVIENMMPRSKWGRNWGDVAHDPSARIWLRDAKNDNIREKYESLYASVYGNKPDNGGLANFFIRAATYYLEENEAVDWAAQASEIYQKRTSNPQLNPQKLIPPCLTKQVQGMVDEFIAAMSSALPVAFQPGTSAVKDHKDFGAADGVAEAKLQLADAKTNEAEAIDEVFRLKNMIEGDLKKEFKKARKAEACHKADLELLFQMKREAQNTEDTAYVQAAMGQISAIAKTICNSNELVHQIEHNLDVNNTKLATAEEEVLLRGSMVKEARNNLLDGISKIGLFPKHALHLLPANGLPEEICPYCARLYVDNAFVPLSCGCRYHTPCMRALILSGGNKCMGCGATPHGTWMAFWDFPLNKQMSMELKEFGKMDNSHGEWIEADCATMGGKSCFYEPESLMAEVSIVPYVEP